MERIGDASPDIAGHTPRVSNICREPLPRAVVRSSKLGCAAESGGTLSMSSTRRDVEHSASAKLAPTMPPPTITTSHSFIGGRSRDRSHEPLDVDGFLGATLGEDFTTLARHHDVVFDADADAMEFLRRARRTGGHVDARLDRERHAGFEDT